MKEASISYWITISLNKKNCYGIIKPEINVYFQAEKACMFCLQIFE